MKYDLIIAGAHVIDPSSGIDGIRDVAVRRGRVAAVAEGIPLDAAPIVHQESGRYLTPGLVDLHTHVYSGATFWGVDPDPIASRSGVTTWIDAGSAGALTFDGFREMVIRRARVTVRSLLNISCIGLAGQDFELTTLQYCDPDVFELVVNANRDMIVGGKVRMGSSTLGESGIEPLARARRALDRCELPMMVHISSAPPDPPEFEHLLRPGDVVTHCCTAQSMRLVDEQGKLKPFAKAWLERGVLLDMGHGTGSFDFGVAEALLAAGVLPAFVSSDTHQNSIDGPMYDLPTCLTKWLDLGMGLVEVVRRATVDPARFLGMADEVGTMKVGARADLALFNLQDGGPVLYDCGWRERRPKRSLVHVGTYLGGRRMSRMEQSDRPVHLEWRRGGRDDVLHREQERVRGLRGETSGV